MHFEAAFVTLFAVATAVALVARWIKVPYTVALVIAGLVLGAVHAFEPPHLTKELLYSVFLPGLLFEAAFHLEIERFWRNKWGILSLAVPGVIAAIALTAVTLSPVIARLRVVDGFRFEHGLVFAALIAATDPIAVVALFRSLGAPKRLTVLVEGESLLNDGTAVVLFTLIMSSVTGGGLSVASALLDFVSVVVVGALLGTALAFAATSVIRRVDDPMIEITLTTIAAYGSFILAEHFHYSGVIATVAAGMVCGNYTVRKGMSPSTRIAVVSFWEYLAFALNSIVFLLIGFEVRMEALLASYQAIIVAYAVVTAVRAAVTFLVSALLRRTTERMPWSWSAVLTWGGLRGSLSMVLALALPPAFPHRELLITMTFGVVVVSILGQGLTMAPLLRRLGMTTGEGRAERRAYQRWRGSLGAVRAALAEIDRMKADGAIVAEVAVSLTEEYERRAHEAEAKLEDLHLRGALVRDEEEQAARRTLLNLERDTVQQASRHGLLGPEATATLVAEVDARLFQLESSEASGKEAPVSVEPPEPAASPQGAPPARPSDEPDPER